MTVKLVAFIFYNRCTNILLEPQLYGMVEMVKADASQLKGCGWNSQTKSYYLTILGNLRYTGASVIKHDILVPDTDSIRCPSKT